MGKYQKWINNNPVKVIIITGILMRLLISFLYQHITLYPDSYDYIDLADRLLYFDLAGYEGQRPPGYPLLLALSGLSNVIAVLLHSAMGVLTLVYVYKTLVLLKVEEKKSLIITLITACYLPIVFFELAILTETFTLFIITLVFYQFFKIIKDKDNCTNKALIKLTILCSLLVLIKVFYVFLPALLFGFLVLKQQSFRYLFSKYLFLPLIPLCMFLGWSYVNKINTGYFVSTTFYGFNIAQNCVQFADKTTPEYAAIGEVYASYRDNSSTDKEVAMSIWEAYPELEKRTNMSFPDLSKELYDYSIATIKLNPLSYLQQVFISWRDFWKTSLYVEYDRFAVPQASNIVFFVSYAERIIVQLVKILFLLLIPYNIIVALKRKRISPQLIISVIILTTSLLQAFATYGTNSRFSFPFELLIIISFALNVFQYRERYKQMKAKTHV